MVCNDYQTVGLLLTFSSIADKPLKLKLLKIKRKSCGLVSCLTKYWHGRQLAVRQYGGAANIYSSASADRFSTSVTVKG